MTESLSQWFLAEFEAGRDPLPTVERLLGLHDEPAQLSAEIDELRCQRDLRNDDAAIVRVGVLADG